MKWQQEEMQSREGKAGVSYSTWRAYNKALIHSVKYAREHTLTRIQILTANWRSIIDQSEAGSGWAETEAGIGREVLLVSKSEF